MAGTLVTAQFLHASVPHVAINMLFLAAFGPEIEYLTGSLRFVALYLCCGVLGGLAQVSVDPSSHVPEIGASGAIAGVLGAYVLRHPTLPLAFGVPAFVVILLWAAVQFVHGFGTISTGVLSERGGGTAYFAHIGGFLAGIFTIGLWQVRAASPRGSIFRYYHR
jgi:membrane associated rhomboid family serine protease